jgi:NADPH:quinone reductase-like Zn-dependent oxidoreductase
MKAIRLHRHGGPEALVVDDAPAPRAGQGELLIEVRAAGVTPSELSWLPTWTTPQGTPRPLPVIPGHEFSGIVRNVGPGVSDFAPGDAVFGMNDWYRDGAQAERCVASAQDVAPKPRSIDHATAAITPISALTAWQGLVERARLEPGERVLVHGGAGAVGSFAVQIGRLCGAHVITTVSAHNAALARRLGADEIIDHRATRFEEVAREVDVVLDTVGGETLERSWNVLRDGGRLVTVAAAGEDTSDPRVRDAFFIVQPSHAQLGHVARLIDAGDLRPLVGDVLELGDARRAYETRPKHGKNVLVVGH